MIKELVCIVCPKGCHLKIDVDNDYEVTGNACEKGEAYGKKELRNPTRTLTSTVRIKGAAISRLPVKTDGEIPKAALEEAVRLLDEVTVTAPVQLGEVVLKGILNSSVNFVATRSLEAAPPDSF